MKIRGKCKDTGSAIHMWSYKNFKNFTFPAKGFGSGSGSPTLLLRGLSLATLLIIYYSDGWLLQDGGSRQARAHQGAALLLRVRPQLRGEEGDDQAPELMQCSQASQLMKSSDINLDSVQCVYCSAEVRNSAVFLPVLRIHDILVWIRIGWSRKWLFLLTRNS